MATTLREAGSGAQEFCHGDDDEAHPDGERTRSQKVRDTRSNVGHDPMPGIDSLLPRLAPSVYNFAGGPIRRLLPRANDFLAHADDPSSVPPQWKTEGSDWFVLYNPDISRTLDVSLLHTFLHESPVCCVHFSSDGKWLATGCEGTAQIFDAQSGQKTCVLAHENADLFVPGLTKLGHYLPFQTRYIPCRPGTFPSNPVHCVGHVPGLLKGRYISHAV
ncbi:hypothetical protein DFH06DRAFT_344928 [Mycena polygramma]|nr:hypothetical protein DFH06DRAFT_344928 [Mycena polygramma]